MNASGDISVDELKIGLSKLSIFMYPYELQEVSLAIPRFIAFSYRFVFTNQFNHAVRLWL